MEIVGAAVVVVVIIYAVHSWVQFLGRKPMANMVNPDLDKIMKELEIDVARHAAIQGAGMSSAMFKQIMSGPAGAGMSGPVSAGGLLPGMAIGTQPEPNSADLMEMITMRLHKPKHSSCGMHYINATKTFGGKVVVFFVKGEEPGYLEDDWTMFPSDALITKLRLII